MIVETYYRILKHNPEGHLVKDSGMIPCRSYVIQFLEMLEAFLGSRDKSAIDVDNAESVLVDVSDTPPGYVKVNAGVGDDTYGIVVGTGDTAVD
ncbi:unnamed protein product, partial [marine sediment metagenome]